jgi:hypothetical protein
MKTILTGRMLIKALFQRRSTPVFKTTSSQKEPKTVKASIAMYPNLATPNLLINPFGRVGYKGVRHEIW